MIMFLCLISLTACGESKEILPGKYVLDVYTQAEDGRDIHMQQIVEIYENTGVENTWYVSLSERTTLSSNDGMDAVVYQTIGNSVVVKKAEDSGLSFYTNPSPFIDVLFYVELEQKDENTLYFRYTEEGEETGAYAELAKVNDYVGETVDYHLTVNRIAGEDVQITKDAMQIIKAAFNDQETILEKNGVPEGLAAHMVQNYPWLVLGVPVWAYETAEKAGCVETIEAILPGVTEGTWNVVSIGGVDYYYGCYNQTPDDRELFSYVITGENIVLENGICVGMIENTLLEICPGLVKVGFDENRSAWQFNSSAYATGFADQYDYFYGAEIMCGCSGTDMEHVPLELAVLIKDGKVAGITAFSPTAN